MERGQTNPRSHKAAASVSPVRCQGQECLTAPHLGRVKKPPPPSPELCQREGDRFVPWDGSTQGQQVWFHFPAHSPSAQGFIPEPAWSQQWFPCSLPPVTVCWAPGKEQHWGLCCGLLSVVVEPEEAGGHCACACTPGPGSTRAEELKSRAERSATSCRAQGAQGHRSGPVVIHQHHPARLQSRRPLRGPGR